MSFFTELKRRNVFRVGAAYLVAAWLVIQLVETIFPAFGFGDSAVRLAVIVLAIGFVPVLILAWAFEITPEGVKRDEEVDRSRSISADTGRKLNRAVVVLLVVAVGYFAVDKFVLAPQSQSDQSTAIAQEAKKPPAVAQTDSAVSSVQSRSVAVLPFVAMSSGEDDGYFADGLTEEILNYLASVPELLVTARTSSFHFKGTDLPIPDIAATLGVANVVEGSVRRAGERVRITAQLIRAADGFHLWSQTYDRTLEDVFAVQEDIARNITEVLDVVLDEQALVRMRNTGIGDVEAFIAYQKGQEAFTAAHSDLEHISDALADANKYYDQVLKVAPGLTGVHLKRADLRGHVLFELVAGFRPEAYPGEAQAVVETLLKDYSLAWESARPGAERAMVEVERTIFSDDWRGLAAKVDQVLASDECLEGNWVSQVADQFGRSAEMAAWQRNKLRCDPLSGMSYMGLTQALVWDARPEEALQAIAEAEALNLYVPFERDMRLVALLAAGHYKEDAEAYMPAAHGSIYPFPDKLFLEARAGTPERARQISDAYLSRPGVDDWSAMVAAAVVGNRDAANAAAARIDSRPGGPFMLLISSQMCFCGAPFDLDATPNFKTRLDESGFPWPPADPIGYPLKNW
jgi:adenylate cyclase